MKYIEHGKGGTPDCMHIADTAKPVPGEAEILIEVAYAGVNRPDVLQRSGKYPPPPGASPILGLEVSGRVAAIGAKVSGYKIGDLVTALTPGGGYAEFCTVPVAQVLPIPAGMDLATAACLPENWFTVWANLTQHGHLVAGERILIHGGSSGIGLTAVQLANHLKAETIVTVGSDEKAVFCKKFGATHAINYRDTDFVTEVGKLTNGGGVDVVLDMVGAPYFNKNLSLLKRDGRLVIVAFLEGSKDEFELMPIMLKRLVVTGSTMRPRTIAEKQVLRDDLLREIWPAIESGEIQTHIHARFGLAQASKAHLLMESSQHIGKIVLEVNPM